MPSPSRDALPADWERLENSADPKLFRVRPLGSRKYRDLHPKLFRVREKSDESDASGQAYFGTPFIPVELARTSATASCGRGAARRRSRLDEGRVVELLRRARSLGTMAESRRTQRETRLRKLGYEQPSDGQRQELAQTIATRDWQRRSHDRRCPPAVIRLARR